MSGRRYHVIVETNEGVLVVDEFTDGYAVAWEEQGTGAPRGQMHLTPEFLSRLAILLMGKLPTQRIPEIIGLVTRAFGSWQAASATSATAAAPSSAARARSASSAGPRRSGAAGGG